MRWVREEDRWHKWFAILPIKIDDTWVWLEWLEYRTSWDSCGTLIIRTTEWKFPTEEVDSVNN